MFQLSVFVSSFIRRLENIYSKRSLQNFKEDDGSKKYGLILIISLFFLFQWLLWLKRQQETKVEKKMERGLRQVQER